MKSNRKRLKLKMALALILFSTIASALTFDYERDETVYHEGVEGEKVLINLGCADGVCYDLSDCEAVIRSSEEQSDSVLSRIGRWLYDIYDTSYIEGDMVHEFNGVYSWEKPKDMPSGEYTFHYSCNQTVNGNNTFFQGDFIFSVSALYDPMGLDNFDSSTLGITNAFNIAFLKGTVIHVKKVVGGFSVLWNIGSLLFDFVALTIYYFPVMVMFAESMICAMSWDSRSGLQTIMNFFDMNIQFAWGLIRVFETILNVTFTLTINLLKTIWSFVPFVS